MQSKKEKIATFDPSGVGDISANIFGLPFNTDEADLIILPVPWDVTASCKPGASKAPESIIKSSPQTNLYNTLCPEAWKAGIATEKIPEQILYLNKKLTPAAIRYRNFIQQGGDVSRNPKMLQIRNNINQASAYVADHIESLSKKYLAEGKYVGLLGGDHSTPIGLIKALSEKHNEFGILQIDAHGDLCKSFEGLEQSHASITFNILPLNAIKKIVQVGVREFSHQESQRMKDNAERIKVFFDHEIKKSLFEGETWKSICKRITTDLPEKVYITFDIDGLEPANCPSTGTPVPGGLSFDQAIYLLDQLVKNKHTVIGFDLVEVTPGSNNDLDTIIAARILFRLSVMLIKTNNLV